MTAGNCALQARLGHLHRIVSRLRQDRCQCPVTGGITGSSETLKDFGYRRQASIVGLIYKHLEFDITAGPVPDRKIQGRIKEIIVDPAIDQIEKGRTKALGGCRAALQNDAGIARLPYLDDGVVQFTQVFEMPIKTCAGQVEFFGQWHDFDGLDPVRHKKGVSGIQPDLSGGARSVGR